MGKKNSGRILHKVDIKLYGARIYLYIGEFQKMRKYALRIWGAKGVKESYIDTYDGAGAQTFTHFNARPLSSIIYLTNTPEGIEGEGTILHECEHVALNILFYLGEEIDIDHQEALVYLTEHLYKEFRYKLDKMENKEKKNEQSSGRDNLISD